MINTPTIPTPDTAMTSINMVARTIPERLKTTHGLVCGLIVGLTPDQPPPTVTHSPRIIKAHQVPTMISPVDLLPTATEDAALMGAKDVACVVAKDVAEDVAFAAARNTASAVTKNAAFITEVATNTAREIMLTSNAAISSLEAICMAVGWQCVVIVLIITPLLIHLPLAHLPSQCMP